MIKFVDKFSKIKKKYFLLLSASKWVTKKSFFYLFHFLLFSHQSIIKFIVSILILLFLVIKLKSIQNVTKLLVLLFSRVTHGGGGYGVWRFCALWNSYSSSLHYCVATILNFSLWTAKRLRCCYCRLVYALHILALNVMTNNKWSESIFVPLCATTQRVEITLISVKVIIMRVI
jgi:hypothetical protein